MLTVYIHTHYLNFVKIRYGLFTLISNLINKAIGINLVQRQMYFVTYYINQNTTKTFFFLIVIMVIFWYQNPIT